MSAFGYGAIRAVVKNSRTRYCMKCAQEKVYGLIRRGVIVLSVKPEFVVTDSDGAINLRDALRYSQAVAIGGVLSEGQAGEQEKLDKLHCSSCKKLLRDDCTDY